MIEQHFDYFDDAESPLVHKAREVRQYNEDAKVDKGVVLEPPRTSDTNIVSLSYSAKQYVETKPTDVYAFTYSREVTLWFKYPVLFD